MTQPQLAPVDHSPLRLRRKNDVLTVDDKASGAVVVDGRSGPYGGPEPFVARTARGVWRIQARGADGSTAVLDGSGRQVATLTRQRFRATVLTLSGGEQIPISGSKKPFVTGAAIGQLARVRAPFLFPQRGYKLTLTDELLARPDRDLIVAIGAYVAESVVSNQIANSTD